MVCVSILGEYILFLFKEYWLWNMYTVNTVPVISNELFRLKINITVCGIYIYIVPVVFHFF